MQKLPILKEGDLVEIIAPASRCTDKHLADLKELLVSWGLNCHIDDAIFGDDLLCANDDTQRFSALKKALENPETKAIICARGGYGSLRLIPELTKLSPPVPKIFLGMSDITALLLFFERQWQWPSIHGALAVDKFSSESTEAVRAMLFGLNEIRFVGKPLNKLAEKPVSLHTSITGGNLSLVQASTGTNWQIDAAGKIILLEEIGERGYRVDRMLTHLLQANVFKDAAAILLGDFSGGAEPDGSTLIQPVLERFAHDCGVPVIQVSGIGHGFINFPVPLGTPVVLDLGQTIQLTSLRNE
ncbi:S66 peptidase family protein [Legionella jamestowniensis]|uniref:LD-carboxypeptidase n=1 Tax=Legionella jamestowniensis TaxID=455 RepID=A0A0W0UFS6_9GAMM|nr:LD-carboxypeptidase [Legionella jamestowniensis]KTD06721.1 LD-carboxypeptidase [Legionella jamestowniensis]OCH97388.1 LD-carboxypeptidase [Legionella jamestowniensis]SFL84175.1 muramoyltetrapeptide carboxypeptidase [Legionella jamestowniensis DSM 19215]